MRTDLRFNITEADLKNAAVSVFPPPNPLPMSQSGQAYMSQVRQRYAHLSMQQIATFPHCRFMPVEAHEDPNTMHKELHCRVAVRLSMRDLHRMSISAGGHLNALGDGLLYAAMQSMERVLEQAMGLTDPPVPMPAPVVPDDSLEQLRKYAEMEELTEPEYAI